jgi:beta-glucosidase
VPVHNRPAKDLLQEALNNAKDADVIVAALGENSNMNGEGASRSNPSVPEPQEELLKALVASGKPVVLVLFTGRPLVLNWEEEHVPAILNAWFPGSEAGTSIAGVLFGDVNPSAKLTTTFPRSVGQMPIYYNHKNTGRPLGDYDKYERFRSDYIDVINAPLYPFGYGLSYTTFNYSNVTLSAAEMPVTGKVTAKVTVTNTGSRNGKEIVQLYIHDVYSTSTRPVKELKGFRKIFLKAGESKDVTFDLTADDLKYYNHELAYVCEPGDFEIMIGPNSSDVKKVKLLVK